MNILLGSLGAIFAIFMIVLLHELGHFLVARAFGIKIVKFSIGFGKALWSKTSNKSGTQYILAVIPLGGYVKMLGENSGEDISPAIAPYAYHKKPLWVRMLVVVSGPLVNFLLAFIAFWIVYGLGITYPKPLIGHVLTQSIAAKAGVQTGDEILALNQHPVHQWQDFLKAVIAQMGNSKQMLLTIRSVHNPQIQQRNLDLSTLKLDAHNPDFLNSLGIVPYQPMVLPIIQKIIVASPAEKAGLKIGDRIIALNGKNLDDWQKIAEKIHSMPNQIILFKINRRGLIQEISIKIKAIKTNSHFIGFLGVQVAIPTWPKNTLYQENYSFLGASLRSLQQIGYWVDFNITTLSKLISGKLSTHTLGGPISIFQAAGQATLAGPKVYLTFIGFISLMIGFINLLPIPGLDGGHLLFQILEAILRRPLPPSYQMMGYVIGFSFLLWLMLQATINDIVRLAGG